MELRFGMYHGEAMVKQADVVVIGSGIAGSAFAATAAKAGIDVVVLERQTAYRDKVRGELFHAWGVDEVIRLDLQDVLVAAGGTWITHILSYDEIVPPEMAEANPFPVAAVRPDVPGGMAVGHPQASQALANAAEAAGAALVRGIGDVVIDAGPLPVVRYELDDVEQEISCRLIVGADGRASSVRRQLGIEFQQTEPLTMGGGILIAGLDMWPGGRVAIGSEGDLHYLVIPRADGTARLYQMFDISQRGRFTGPDRQRELLDSYRMTCLPLGEDIATSTPAGPVGFYPFNDSWTDSPCRPGVVLIGDAAGWSDPIIGQGLSIAMRDARMVADVISSADDWSEAAFEGYVVERAERMRRLRISARLQTEMQCVFNDAGRQRRRALFSAFGDDPLLAAATFVTVVGGPDVAPAEAFTPDNIARIMAIA